MTNIKRFLTLFLIATLGMTAWGANAVFTFNTSEGLAALGITEPAANSSTALTSVSISPVTITGAKNNASNPASVFKNSGGTTIDLRLYKYGSGGTKGSSITISVSSGYKLTGISGLWTSRVAASSGTLSSGSWTPPSSTTTSVEIYNNNGSNTASGCTVITVSYESTGGGGDPTLSSIAVKTPPTKVSYTEGENFDPTGLVITRTYSDASTSDYAYAGHTSDFSFTPSLSTALTIGNTSVTITYGGKSTTQAITVTSGGGGGGSGSCDVFSETWDGCDGTGGNSGGWSGSVASGTDITSDNAGWTYSTGYEGDKCIRTNKAGYIRTPSISVTSGSTYTLSYKAADWGTDGCSFTISATGATVTEGASSGALSTGSWGDYTATLTATASTMQITFTASSGDRGWLDEICIGSSGPIKVTSSFTEFTYVLGSGPSGSQTFKVEGTDLDGNLTITAPTNYQVSQNGSSWSNSVTLNKNAGDDVPETTLYIRLNSGLAKGDYDGNITFSDGTNNKTVAVEGSVTLACATPSISFTEATVNKYRGDADFKITPSVSGNTLGAVISWSSDKESCATVGSDGTVHILKATGAGAYVRITATLPYTETAVACQNEVSAYYDIYIKNKVTWLVSGATYSAGGPDTEVTEGATITTAPTDPDGSSVCGGKTFVGWTTSEVAVEQSSAPDPLYSATTVLDVNITNNITFHAVFAEETTSLTSTTYSLVGDYAEDFVSGEDYVLANYYSSKDKALNATVTGSYYLTGTDVTIPSSNTFQTTNGRLVWKITTEGTDQVSLYNEETGKYAYLYHPSGTYYDLGLRDDKYIWTISNVKETGYSAYFTFTASDYPSYKLAWDNSNTRYAAKTTSDGYLYLYKKAIEYTYDAYSTTCGPSIKANEVERLTSTKDQTVKSQAITIKGSSLGGGTLSVKSITGDASHFACTLASSTITAGAIETTYTISYTPTVYGATHTAEIIFTDGTTDSDPITLRGRSLPEHFAVVAYDGANYYALDGSMSGTASTVRAIPVTVTAGVVDYCPSRGIYSLTDLDTPDQNVHITSATGRLYGEGSGTGLNIHSFTSNSGTGWLLTTTDFVNYHVTNATTATRGIMYNSTYDVIGHYTTTNYGKANYAGDIQFLPFTNECTCLDAPQHVTVVAKATRATITWDEVAGATDYDVTCVNASTSATEGSISIDAVNRTATITNLTNLTNYNFTVKAIATGTDCSLAHTGHFRTTNCDDVPYGIRVTPAINSATFKWSMEAASATIQIFSDEECTAQVGSDHTGLTSPATITGLEENTQYYAKILAGGTCESGMIDFQTNSPSVEIAEWFPDSIRIIIDAGADASVTIEDKQEHGSSTTNYADKLFISKYFEADGNNKMIAIFNGTPDTIDITNMWLYRSQISTSEKKICLKKFGKVPGKILPNEEIIIMRYTSDSDAAKKCAEKEDNYDEWNIINSSNKSDGEGNDIYTWLQFSGPQSIGLYDGSTSKFIDVIGATTNNEGTGKLVQIYASTSISCSHTENSNNDGSGFFADGKDIRDGRDIVLSTNRCLLIRKNTVKSGDDAVANNVYATQQTCDDYIGHAFTTLGDEWLGFIIGAGAHAADSTCEGLAYVGGFDYNGYYTTYDSIGGIKDLSGQQNDDGTYTISIPQLDTLSCSTMRIKVYESNEVKAQREYQVPIMVDTDKEWKTTDTIFQNKWHDLTTCETCDVVILKGATLTKDEDGKAKDAATVGNLTIYPGGTLNIPNVPARTFNVASIQFRVEGENVPLIKLAGTLQTSDQQVLVSRRINNSEAYFFSLPYDCNLSDIRWSNGEPAVLDDGFRIKEYDSRARADQGSTKGAPGHWKMVTGSTLEAGKGYQISVNSKYLKELIFPLDLGKTNVSDAENEKNSNGDNVVPIHQYENGATTINNHNWNFIAQPYLCAMSPMAGDDITYGYLDWKVVNDEVVWERKYVGNQYLTMYNPSSKTYDQKFWSTVSQLDPFVAFFVQGKTEGDFTFTEGNRKNSAPARHLASQAEVDDDPSIFVGVTLSGNGLTDQANLRVRQDFTTEEYKLGYDLLKFTTYYQDRPQIYMKTPSYQLAFQAVSDSVARNTFLPMGVYCYNAGTYTFGLSEDYPIDEIEAVYLYDAQTNTTTNLLYNTYSITTTKQLYSNARFSLNVIVNRKTPQVTTDIETGNAPENMVRKILINGHVYIQRGGDIYDVTGKQLLNR